ncbi:MAG: MFS transporter [Candidatus Promineifilaceae bacterium]|nr:MFS transporter [Candidatus Promineifilaceae bacterium]
MMTVQEKPTAVNHFHLPPWQMILYASGSLAVALSYQAFATYIQFLYIDILGLSAAVVGVVWSIYGVWNAVNDPLSGYWSDRTRSRWGRRIPWIAGAFLPLALTFYLLWLPPTALVNDPGRLLLFYFLALVLAFDLLWTIVAVNWTALFPEMIPDQKQRAAVSGWRQTFSLVGLMVGVALPPLLAGETWTNRGSMALLLAVIVAVFFALSLLGSRERQTPQSAPLPFWAALRATARNRNFLIFLGANLAIQLIFMLLTATTPFYTKYVLRLREPVPVPGAAITLDVATQTSLFLAVAFIAALPAMLLWTIVARRQGAWWALRAVCLAAAATLLLFFLPDSFYEGIAATALFGLSLAGLMMLPDLLIAELVDADEAVTGVRREGFYFGVNGFVIRFAFSIQGLLSGYILTRSGYVAASATVLYPEQPPAAILGIRMLIGGLPALAALLAFLVLGGYRLRSGQLSRKGRPVVGRPSG